MTTPTPALPRHSRLNHWLLIVLATVLCVSCLAYLSVRHLIWPRLDEWRPQIVARIEHAIGRRLEIGSLRPGWKGLHPTLEIDDVSLGGLDGRTRLTVHTVRLRLSWRSLIQGTPRLAELHLQAPRAEFERLPNGRLQFAGFLLPNDGRINEPLLDWLMSQGDITAREAIIVLRDERSAWPESEISALTLTLSNRGRHHELAARTEHPLAAGGRASVALQFDRPAFSKRVDWQRWSGEVHVATQALAIEPLARIVTALNPTLSKGRATAQGSVDELGWMRFDAGRLVDARMKVSVASPSAVWQGGRIDLKSFAGDLHAQRAEQGGLVLSLEQIALSDGRGANLAGHAQLQLAAAHAASVQSAHLSVEPFDIAPVMALFKRVPAAAAMQTVLRPIDASGRVSDLALDWQSTSGAAPPRRSNKGLPGAVEPSGLSFSANLDRVSVSVDRSLNPVLAAFSNVSGSVQGSLAHGSARLGGQGVSVSLPRVFAEPRLDFDRLQAELTWDRETKAGMPGLRIMVPTLELANADASGQFSGQWHRDAPGSGRLELKGRLERAQVARVARYLPLGIPVRVRDWVAAALPSGLGEDVVVDVQGDLKDFPFRDPTRGVFRIAGRFRDTTLAFAPQWPPLDRIQADFDFSRAGFSVLAQSATSGSLKLSDVRARLNDYREPMLLIDGRVGGRAQDMLQFVDDSPLASTVSRFTHELHIEGDARLGLSLALPLNQLASSRVQGTVEFAGNEVIADRTLPAFSNVTGQVGFTEQGVELQGLNGTLLGGPIRVVGRAGAQGGFRLDASGQIDEEGIRRLVDNPLTRALHGRTGYTARLESDRRTSSIVLESNLVGLASALPAPFVKAAHEAWPLRVVSSPSPAGASPDHPAGDRLDVRLNDRIALLLERERDPSTARSLIRRAGFAVNDEPVLREGGLSVVVRTPSLDFDAWRALLGGGDLERMQRDAQGAAAPGMTLMPNWVSVVADDVRMGGRDLHDVVLGATRSEGRWRANIASHQIVGHFDWLDARPGERIGTLTARFDRLELPRSREAELESALSGPPDTLPALDITVERLALGKVQLGRLSLDAANEGTEQQPVWRLRQLRVENPQATLQARGVWSFNRAPDSTVPPVGTMQRRSTDLTLLLDVHDAGALLERMGIPDTVKGGEGRLEGAVSWTGSPLAIDLPSLSGDMRVELGQGTFLKADPGVARLIAVLNMQSLQRLLTGDLGRIFGQGFAFDQIDGSVHIEGGIAQTDSLQMRGAQAQVSMTGQADLKRETQDLHVHVTPELDAGLASIAVGAMINPVLGLGSLAAQYVLRKPLQEALGFDIDITGSWTEPNVRERARRQTPSGEPPPMP